MSDPFPALSAKTEKALYETLLTVWKSVKQVHTLKEIEQVYLTGGIPGLMSLLDNLDPVLAANMSPILNTAMIESGRAVIAILPAAAITTPAWLPSLSLSASRVAMEYEYNLIRDISTTTKDAVRASVTEAVATGKPPAAIARQFRSTIGITEGQQKWVSNYRRALEEGSQTALDYKLRDARYDASVRNGTLTQDKIDTMVERYEQRLIKYRSEVIARTEGMRAIDIGQEESVRQGVEAGHIDPELEKGWVTTQDQRERPWHDELHKKWVKFNEPFVNSHGSLMYPRDPNASASNTVQCRCRRRFRLPPGR